jgi:hypothetical protein
MNRHAGALPPRSRKLLGFTDNRQDAALQAGHFNDFLFVALLRAAVLAAVHKAGALGLSEQDFGRSVQAALGSNSMNRERRRVDARPRGQGRRRRTTASMRCLDGLKSDRP